MTAATLERRNTANDHGTRLTPRMLGLKATDEKRRVHEIKTCRLSDGRIVRINIKKIYADRNLGRCDTGYRGTIVDIVFRPKVHGILSDSQAVVTGDSWLTPKDREAWCLLTEVRTFRKFSFEREGLQRAVLKAMKRLRLYFLIPDRGHLPPDLKLSFIRQYGQQLQQLKAMKAAIWATIIPSKSVIINHSAGKPIIPLPDNETSRAKLRELLIQIINDNRNEPISLIELTERVITAGWELNYDKPSDGVRDVLTVNPKIFLPFGARMQRRYKLNPAMKELFFR